MDFREKVNWASRLETKKFQIELATTCNKNEQQQNDKNKSELWTKWTKTTWKTFEEGIRRGRNRSIKAWLVTGDGGDDVWKGWVCNLMSRKIIGVLELWKWNLCVDRRCSARGSWPLEVTERLLRRGRFSALSVHESSLKPAAECLFSLLQNYK
jgi:hypothetical protein